MAKKRPEPSGGDSKKRGKSKRRLLSAPESAARKAIHKPLRENPFDSIWSRRKKLDVVGGKRRGEDQNRRVGRSRSLAFDVRSRTLLDDYRRSRKSSAFVDRRIGEGDDALGEFDKSILRLQRERQTKLKKESKYNLSDGEEDDFGSGISLSKVDDFDEEIPFDEEEDAQPNVSPSKDRFLSLQTNSMESNSSDANENKQKSKKQVYEEIMAKSKFHKALKAKEKEADEQLLEQLDKDFSSLAQSEVLISLTQPTKMNALKALLNQNSTKQLVKEELSTAPADHNSTKEKPDAYDILLKKMTLDARAHPSDRTKTPEEIAQEEKKRLELLEEERRKRMLATEDSDDENDEDPDGSNKLSLNNTKDTRHLSGDDLGDSTSIEGKLSDKLSWADLIRGRKNIDDDGHNNPSSDGSDTDESGCADADAADSSNNEDDDGDDEDDDGEGDTGNVGSSLVSVKDWEQSDEDLDTDVEAQIQEDPGQMDRKRISNDNVGTEAGVSAYKLKPGKLSTVKVESLPFAIEAPRNITELCSLLDNRSDPEIIEAVSRIRAWNAVKISAENRKKMQVFYGVLLQYFAVLTTKRPLNFKLINLLLRPLVEMSMDTPYFAAICARERLIHIRKQFCEDIKNSEKSSWPSLKTLMLLRLWSLIFPCSDFRHVVMTPATLLMCEYLMRCPILYCRDTAVGSFLCSMLLLIAKQSRKFFPEAIIFLQVLLTSAVGSKQGVQKLSRCNILVDLKTSKSWLCPRNQASCIHPLVFPVVMDSPVESPLFDSDDFRVSVLSSAVETLRGFVDIHDGLSSFPEIFLPVSSVLHDVIKQNGIPDSLRKSMEDTADMIRRKSDELLLLRQPLQMRKQKPVPLRLMNPKFEENYEKGRDYDPDRERVERKKLKKLLRREAKGAARELRKDNYFLLEAKEKDRLIVEEERAERYGKARAFLQEQEHAFKSGQLGKGRKRRR